VYVCPLTDEASTLQLCCILHVCRSVLILIQTTLIRIRPSTEWRLLVFRKNRVHLERRTGRVGPFLHNVHWVGAVSVVVTLDLLRQRLLQRGDLA
jgi:hypothetical protein